MYQWSTMAHVILFKCQNLIVKSDFKY